MGEVEGCRLVGDYSINNAKDIDSTYCIPKMFSVVKYDRKKLFYIPLSVSTDSSRHFFR